MRRLNYNDIFNDNSLNIFTDASITTKYNIVYGCPGFISIDNKDYTNCGYSLFNFSTNNQSEIYAIYLGLQEAMRMKYLKGYSQINLFSDSKISVFGLREWIKKWSYNPTEDLLYSSSGTPVANQEIFLRCVYIIMKHKLPIKLFHVDGHKNCNNSKDLQKFTEDFKSNNGFDTVDIDLMKSLIMMNDKIDNYTRDQLTVIDMEKSAYTYLKDRTFEYKYDKDMIMNFITYLNLRRN